MAVARLLLRPYLLLPVTFLAIFSPMTFSITESDALLKLKSSFTNAGALDSWVLGSIPCTTRKGEAQWIGILCFDGIVTGLRLSGLGLSGKIDVSALQEIKSLRTISFENNSFSGSIPEFSSLAALRAIYLSGNHFSGEISSDFFAKMDNLKKLRLSENKFSGNLPASLSQLSRLIELHLENNEFTGTIPFLDIPTLAEFDISNNKLEGEIPASLSRFNVSSFLGNVGLCGEKLGKDCRNGAEGSQKIVAAAITSGVVIVSIVVLLIFRSRRKREEDFDMLGNEKDQSTDDQAPVEVHVTSVNKKEPESLRKAGSNNSASSSRKAGGSSQVKSSSAAAVAEIVMVNEEKGVFGMPDLMKAAAEVLGNGGMSSSYKAVMANGMAVVVKRIKEMNVMGKDEFDLEIRRLGKLRHWNVLTPLAYHYRKDEKLLVSEYVPKGSLLYLLHGDRGSSHAELNWPARLRIARGIARGLEYLHIELASFEVPHGNLKSSNVLLGPDFEPLISDFGFGPLISPASLPQALLAYKTPEAFQGGHVSHKSDVYCLGIVILELLTGKFPSQYLSTGKGGTDAVQWVSSAISEGRETELLDPEIANGSKNSLVEMQELLHIGAACAESNPEHRLEAAEAARRIEEIVVHQETGQCQEGRNKTMQVLPSLRDGYADSMLPQFNSTSLREDHGELSGRKRFDSVSSVSRSSGRISFAFPSSQV
ncbi:hypothetical protein UlMin_012038 [Ulmus minor]